MTCCSITAVASQMHFAGSCLAFVRESGFIIQTAGHVTCLFWVCSSWKHIQSELCILVRGHGDMASLRPILTKTLPVLYEATLFRESMHVPSKISAKVLSLQGSRRGPCLLGSTAAWILNFRENCRHYTFRLLTSLDFLTQTCHFLIHYSWLWTILDLVLHQGLPRLLSNVDLVSPKLSRSVCTSEFAELGWEQEDMGAFEMVKLKRG